jgi:tetratricopeptide (TPR) repeat protein
MVALRLIDQSDSHTIWAERFSVTLDGMAALHRTALRQLALALNVHLSTPRLQNVREASPMGRKYELWMQAQVLGGEWRPESDARAQTILRDLIATTPDFAPAMVALAQLINATPIVYPGKLRNRRDLDECLALTARAVNLDPLDSRTHLCRAWAHSIAGAHGAALSHLDLALDLNENDPWTIISAGLGYAFAGELVRARKLVSQAQGFGMRHSRAAQGYVATASYLIGDYEASVGAAEVAGDAIINLPAWQAASLMHLRRPGEASLAIERFLTLARAAWIGEDGPEDGQILDWFMGCFPIRADEVRADLRDSLDDALRERGKRRG